MKETATEAESLCKNEFQLTDDHFLIVLFDVAVTAGTSTAAPSSLVVAAHAAAPAVSDAPEIPGRNTWLISLSRVSFRGLA